MHRREIATWVTTVLLVTACSGTTATAPSSVSQPTAGGSTGPASSSAAPALSGKVGIDYALVDSPFMTLVDAEIKTETQKNGLEPLPALNAALDVTKQNTDVKNLITQGVKALIVMPIDTAAIVSSLKDAEAAKIPVVAFDTLPDDGPLFMSVRTNNIEMGAKACEHLGELTKGAGTVAEVQGDLASIAGRERSKGFEDCVASKFPQMKVLKIPAVWDPAKASSGLEAVLTSNPELAGVYIHSGGGYLAAVLQVLKRKNLLFPRSDPKHMPLVSIDGEPAELQAIRDGYLDSTVSQPADLYGRLSAFYAAQAILGTTFAPGPTDHGSTIIQQPANILEDSLPSAFVDEKNVDDPTLWANASK